MRLFIAVIATGLLITSCGLREKPTEPVKEMSEDATEIMEEVGDDKTGLEATVKDYKDKNKTCGLVLEIKQKDGTLTIGEPGTIPEQFAKDGTQVRVTYIMSRRQTTCELAVPIVIESIEKM